MPHSEQKGPGDGNVLSREVRGKKRKRGRQGRQTLSIKLRMSSKKRHSDVMLEAEEGERVWQRLDSKNGPCPRVHEVRLQGESCWMGFEVGDLMNTGENCSERLFIIACFMLHCCRSSGEWNAFKPLSLYQLKPDLT